MRYGLLGPVEVWTEQGEIDLGGELSRRVLAALLLDANHVVPVHRLIEATWGDDPPVTVRAQAQNRVSGLRRLLRAAGGGADPITHRGSGYLITITEGQLDLHLFDSAVARAESLAAAGRTEQARRVFDDALTLWRGPALDGVESAPLRTIAVHLEERRLTALERRIDLDLALGQHAQVVSELDRLVRAQPYRERLRALLMHALSGSGRQTEALEVYRRTRHMLIDHLGVEPGPELRRLHEALLRGGTDPEPPPARFGHAPHQGTRAGAVPRRPAAMTGAPPPRPVARWHEHAPHRAAVAARTAPRLLPANPSGFTGRSAVLDRLDRALDLGGGSMVLTGPAGVGKTALAVHWAHRVAARFPGGQLHINLHGLSANPPLTTRVALRTLLGFLGVTAPQVPPTVTEAAALYRSVLANRRVLVLLDNARSADQIRPLLPGSPQCLALVTSRERLGGLVVGDGAHQVELGPLVESEARELLVRGLGSERAGIEPTAVDELVRMCAGLPLALRIIVANLAGRPRRSLADEAAALRGTDGLGALVVADDRRWSVREAFDRSYLSVPGTARRLFRLLGLVSTCEFDPATAAALMDSTPAHAGADLERLAAAHLIVECTAPRRYTFHDLLRRYARERLAAEVTPAERRAAQRRLADGHRSGSAHPHPIGQAGGYPATATCFPQRHTLVCAG